MNRQNPDSIANAMQVKLPGGLWENNRLIRSVSFSNIDGKMEQTLAGLNPASCTMPEYVTQVLCLTLRKLGDNPPDRNAVESLCMADRQFLMLHLSAMFKGDSLWLRSTCTACGKLFDINILRSELPVSEAIKGFPFQTIKIDKTQFRVRVPDGADQSLIADLPEDEAISLLLERCVSKLDGTALSQAMIADLSAADIRRIEQALENVSPAVCTTLQTDCPECGKEQHVGIDPYDFRYQEEHSFYEEVHAIAFNYHWTEQEILALSRVKRRMYIDLIERDTGLMV